MADVDFDKQNHLDQILPRITDNSFHHHSIQTKTSVSTVDERRRLFGSSGELAMKSSVDENELQFGGGELALSDYQHIMKHLLYQ